MPYKVINGFNYPGEDGEVGCEIGDVLPMLPADYAQDIIEAGCVEEIGTAASSKAVVEFATAPLDEEDAS